MTVHQSGIGLLGGTFDPVHNGHLAVAHAALQELDLLRVDLVPAPAPWQKNVLTPIDVRVKLIQSAIAKDHRLSVNLTEVLRSGPTYTIDTLRELRTKVGPYFPLVLILGADQWENFHTWKDWPEFLGLANIALCNRENAEPIANPEVTKWAAPRFVPQKELSQVPCGAISTFKTPAHAASSTKIREIFATRPRYEAFKELESWLPLPVSSLIAELNLYQSCQSQSTNS